MGTATGFDFVSPFGDKKDPHENKWVDEVYMPPSSNKEETQLAATNSPEDSNAASGGDNSTTDGAAPVAEGAAPVASDNVAFVGDQVPEVAKGNEAPAANAPLVLDKSAQYVPVTLVKSVEDLIALEPNTSRKEMLEKLKGERSNAERIKLLESLINGKLDNETRREILPAESSPERKRLLEDLILREKEIEQRYKMLRDTVLKTLPDFKDFYLHAQDDQQRQGIYLSLIKEDGIESLKKLKDALGHETDKDRQNTINKLIDDDGSLDRIAVVKELIKTASDPREKQLLEEVLGHETNIQLFGRMIDEIPTDETIKAVADLFKNPVQQKRLESLIKGADQARGAILNQLIRDAQTPAAKQEFEALKLEQSPAERIKTLQRLLAERTELSTRKMLQQLLDAERTMSISIDLPKEETRRRDMNDVFTKVERGDYDAVMKGYTLCADWLKRSVPDAFVENGAEMGLATPPGSTLKLPIEHGKPIPPRLMEMYAKEGRVKLELETNADSLLNPSEKVDNVANLINSVSWLYETRTQIREAELKFQAKDLVDTLKLYYGADGVAKYGPDGIPPNWMPPQDVEGIPAWRDRVLKVINLGNRLRNYAQTMKTIDGIQSSEKGLQELKDLGVQFEFGKNGQLLNFSVPSLEALDLRLQIPINYKPIGKLEDWLSRYHKDVDKALDPYKEAVNKMLLEKDPKAFLRFGDFPYNESIHPKVGVPYDVVKHRVKSVTQKGGNIVIEGTIDYQTAGYFSYNYWLDCKQISHSMSLDEFRRTNNLPDGAQPEPGKRYKIKADDGNVYENWGYEGKNADGTLKFVRDETFRMEIPATEYVPAMTAMGGVELVPAYDVQRWLWGWKLEGNPTRWELPQSTFWHHGVKFGKVVMDGGLLLAGGYGSFAVRGASWGARAMSFGRMAVGVVGLTHHIIDHKLPISKEWKDGIHTASHVFILADVGMGLGAATLRKAFGIGVAAKESASLLSTLGHGAMAVDGIAVFGPIVASDIKNVIDNHMGWTTEQILNRALEERGTPERLVVTREEAVKEAKFDLSDKAVRQSMEIMIDRLGKTVLTDTTDAKTRERVEKLLKDGTEILALDRNDPRRKNFVAELSRLFSPSDAQVVLNHATSKPGSFETRFVQDARAKAGTGNGAVSPEEKLVASALALVLQSNEKGELPASVLTRQVTIPAHRELIGNRWQDVAETKVDVSVNRDEVIGFIQELSGSSDRDSLRMAACKMLWRMGKLDHNGLAGVLLDVARKSNNRELVGLALTDSKDVSLGYLLNDITHNEVLVARSGYAALQDYRARYYGLTSDQLKHDLKAVMTDTTKGADIRAMALEILNANDHDKVQDRKAALEECDRRWQKEKGKDGSYASDLVKAIKFQAQQEVGNQPQERRIRVTENGVEKQVTVTVQPDDVRLEKFRALNALKALGPIQVDGQNYQATPEMLNANMLKCLSRTNSELTSAVINAVDCSKLTAQERRDLLGVLGWPNNNDTQKVKVELLKRIRDIVGGDREIASETKTRLLDMLNPVSRPRGESDYSFCGTYPDQHAAAITALASFGSQHLVHAARSENMTPAVFESRLVAGQTKDLIYGKYYQLRQDDSQTVAWFRYMGKGQDGKERFVAQGDPTVATIIQHLKSGDQIGSAKVRLAVAQAAGDLQIPGLRELMNEAIKKETDPRVARRLREVRFPEEPPLDPQSDQSIDKLNEYLTAIIENRQFRHLDHYGTWLKDNYPKIFEHRFNDDVKKAIDGVYGYNIISFAWDEWGPGSKTPDQHWNDAVKGVDAGFEAELTRLIDGAKSSTSATTRENSIMALLWIVTNRGTGTDATGTQGMPFRWRKATVEIATAAFLKLSEVGSKDRGGAVKWAVEKLLTQQPDLQPDHKMILLEAAVRMAHADKDGAKNDQAMTKEHLAKVVYMATKATAGFPRPSDGERYTQEVNYHKALIGVLTHECADASSTELLEAIAKEHPSQEVRDAAERGVLWLRDGVHRNIVNLTRNKTIDTTADASTRKESILNNLSDSSKTTEDVVDAIVKACEGYPWMKPGADAADDSLRAALRQGLNDNRVRVKIISAFYLTIVGRAPDMVDAVETLETIRQSEYKYATSPRPLKYYKVEADEILKALEKSTESASKEVKEGMALILKLGKERAQGKRDGVLTYDATRPDRNKSAATALQELETVLNNDNAPESEIVKAVFTLLGKQREVPGAEDGAKLYKRGLTHRSEKVRLASAWALSQTATKESDLDQAVDVLKAITAGGGSSVIKQEAGQGLRYLSQLNRFATGGLTNALRASTASSDRTKSIGLIKQGLADGKPDELGVICSEIFALRSQTGKMEASDPALATLRDALKSEFVAVSLSAAMVLAEQSPDDKDWRAAIGHIVDIQRSNRAPRFRQDAEAAVNRLKQAKDGRLEIVNQVLAAADADDSMIEKAARGVEISKNTNFEENAQALAVELKTAQDNPTRMTSDAAIKAIVRFGFAPNAMAKDGPVCLKIRETAASHPDERVRLAAAWILSQTAEDKDDESAGYKVLAELVEGGRSNNVRVEANGVLSGNIAGYQGVLNDNNASDDEKKHAQFCLDEIARHKESAKKAMAR